MTAASGAFSAHSAIETQRFYRSLGCVDAAQPLQKHVEAEPFDSWNTDCKSTSCMEVKHKLPRKANAFQGSFVVTWE